jgi:hypothetical protein
MGDPDPISDAVMRIVFTTSDSLFSRAIRWFTRSSVSHVLLHVYDYFTFEAGGLSVHIRPWHEVKNVVAVFRIRPEAVPTHIVDECIQESMRQHGKGYDWLGILGFAYCIFMERFFGKDLQNPFAQQSSYWCSELVAYFLNKVNQHQDIGMRLRPDDFSPEDLILLLRSRPDVFEEIE